MSTALLDHTAQAGAQNGGVPARRAVIRWAWRMFRREWRQQMLVLALIVVALAATVVGAAVATNTPPPAGAGFGTAQEMANAVLFLGSDESSFITASTFLVDGGISAAYVTPE